MPMSEFAQYAAIASFFFVLTSITILLIKARIDSNQFQKNLVISQAVAQIGLEKMLGTADQIEFDAHVESTPGMKHINLN